MPIDLASVLPVLLPKAIDWAIARSNEILSHGEPLSETGIKLAPAVVDTEIVNEFCSPTHNPVMYAIEHDEASSA